MRITLPTSTWLLLVGAAYAPLAAAGCCCLSQPDLVESCPACMHGHRGSHPALAGKRVAHDAAPKPLNAPLPKFHPVPTRPVFEPPPNGFVDAGLHFHVGQPHLAPLPSN